MKKIISAVLVAFLLSLGLVSTSSSPASAACPPSGCLPTETNALKLKPNGKNKARVFVRVTSFGNGKPDGSLNVTFVRRTGKSFQFARIYPSRDDRKFVYTFRPLPRGTYSVIVTFVPPEDSAYEGSSDQINELKVRGDRRR